MTDKWEFKTFKKENILSAMDARLIDNSRIIKRKREVITEEYFS